MKITKRDLRSAISKIVIEGTLPSMADLGLSIFESGTTPVTDATIRQDILSNVPGISARNYTSIPVFKLSSGLRQNEIDGFYQSIGRGQSDGDAGEYMLMQVLETFLASRYPGASKTENINHFKFVKGQQTGNFFGIGPEAFPAFDVMFSDQPEGLKSIQRSGSIISLPHLISAKFSGTVTVENTAVGPAAGAQREGTFRQAAKAQPHKLSSNGKNFATGCLAITMAAILNTDNSTLSTLKTAALRDISSGALVFDEAVCNIGSWLASEGIDEIQVASTDGISISAIPYLTHGNVSSETAGSIKSKPVYCLVSSQSDNGLPGAGNGLILSTNGSAAGIAGVDSIIFDRALNGSSIRGLLGLIDLGTVKELMDRGGDPTILTKNVAPALALSGVLEVMSDAASSIENIFPSADPGVFVQSVVSRALSVNYGPTANLSVQQNYVNLEANLKLAGHGQIYDKLTDVLSSLGEAGISNPANTYLNSAIKIISELSTVSFGPSTKTVVNRKLKMHTILQTLSLLRRIYEDNQLSAADAQKDIVKEAHNSIASYYIFCFQAGFLDSTQLSKLFDILQKKGHLHENAEVIDISKAIQFIDNINKFHEELNIKLAKFIEAHELAVQIANIISAETTVPTAPTSQVEVEPDKEDNVVSISDYQSDTPMGGEERTVSALNTNSSTPEQMVAESKIYSAILRELMKY